MKTKDTPRYKMYQILEEDINQLLEVNKIKATHNMRPISKQEVISRLKENINLQNYISEAKVTSINKIWKDYNESDKIPPEGQSMLGKSTNTLKYLISYRQYKEDERNKRTNMQQ